MIDRYIAYYQNILIQVTDKVQDKLNVMHKKGDIKITGTGFEDIVYESLLETGLSKEQIQHSPQKFPDFVIFDIESGKKVGLEVKKTDSNKWKVPGGSVFESLRNETEETYVLMGKLGGVPETRLRKYQACIEDLTVTHSPRFQLNLDLDEGEDYLTKNDAQDLLNLSEGDELNRRIRELLRTSRSTWYSEQNVTAYSELSQEEKEKYLNDGVALFPEVVGRDYTKFTPWMVYKCLIWCGNVRDIFSAGGTVLRNGMYISAVMNRILTNTNKIFARIATMTKEEQIKYWGKYEERTIERIDIWIDLINKNLKFSTKLVNKNKQLPQFADKNKEEIEYSLGNAFINELRQLMKKCGNM